MSLFSEVLDIAGETVGNLVQWGFSTYRNDYSHYVRRVTRKGQAALQDALAVSLRVGIIALKWTIVIGTLLGSATVIYAFLYLLIMPRRTYDRPLFFDYGTHADLRDSLVGTNELPTATVDFLTRRTQWYINPEIDTEVRKDRILNAKTFYDVIVTLTLPLSEMNEKVGVFMVTAELKDHSQMLLARSLRSATISQQFWLVRTLRTLAWALPTALGIQEQEEELSVIVFNGYEESYDHPVAFANITLSHPMLQLYGGRISVIAQLTGIRYYMYHWFLTTAVLSVLHIAFFEGIGLMVLYLAYSSPHDDLYEEESDKSEDITLMKKRRMEHANQAEREEVMKLESEDEEEVKEMEFADPFDDARSSFSMTSSVTANDGSSNGLRHRSAHESLSSLTGSRQDLTPSI